MEIFPAAHDGISEPVATCKAGWSEPTRKQDTGGETLCAVTEHSRSGWSGLLPEVPQRNAGRDQRGRRCRSCNLT